MMVTKAGKKEVEMKPDYPRKAIPCLCDERADDDSVGQAFARVVTSPAVAAHRVIVSANPKNLRDEIDAPGMLAVLEQQAAAVNRGDMAQAEAMLMNQATALQSLFTYLIERGLAQSLMPNIEGFLRMALRAQSQCRATLETLATIKNPPIVYARQANVTTGPQQINNGAAAPAQARKIENEQTQLLRAEHEQWMDTGAENKTIGGNPAVATLGKIDRAEDRRR